jgi:nucleotide-binding universal stress UspA family protein
LPSIVFSVQWIFPSLPHAPWSTPWRWPSGSGRGSRWSTAHVIEGVPYLEIMEAAKGRDLIVMGTHGRSGLSHMLLGSVAEQVVRGSEVPVLTIRSAGSP